MRYDELYLYGVKQLEEAGIAEAKLDARLLLEHVCGTDRNTLLIHPELSVKEEQEKSYVIHIENRARRIPLQHITGVQEFMGLEFYVNQDVLIPRQDTEILVEEVMLHVHDGMSILDVCTGSGCILISLLQYSNDCGGVGIDLSSKALETAKRNAEEILGKRDMRVMMENAFPVQNEIHFLQGDLLQPLNMEALTAYEAQNGMNGKGAGRTDPERSMAEKDAVEVKGVWEAEIKFDLIVSNPPYIPTKVIPTLEPEVAKHEPLTALDGGEDGLYFYREIIREAAKYLIRGGMLFFEIGYDQGEAVSRLLEDAGYVDIEIKKDYAGLDRVVFGTFLED